MNLVWKLLRKHISLSQFAGFFLANLVGMLVVMLGYQIYKDVLPIFTSGDSFMRADYLIITKPIGAGTSLSGDVSYFDNSEVDELNAQSFVQRTGKFTSTEYRVDAALGVGGKGIIKTELFFESVPDEFVDVPIENWGYQEGDEEVPIILPRSYINMYNFGFAHNRSLPKISEGLAGMIDVNLSIHGNGQSDTFQGRVVGFSSRLNTILVPQAFMDWSNEHYAAGKTSNSSRLIVEVKNPADEKIMKYFDSKGYEVETDKLAAEKTTYFLRLIVTLVIIIGLIISALSFYILMLSVFLLVQKNSEKLENLLLIGYSPTKVALPYQILTIALNAVVVVIALIIVAMIRKYYMEIIETIFPQIEEGSLMPSILVGFILLVVVSVLNIFAIRRKILRVWQRR